MLCVCVCVFVFVIAIVIVIVLVGIIVIFKNFKLCGIQKLCIMTWELDFFVFFLTLSREPNNTLWFIIFLIL